MPSWIIELGGDRFDLKELLRLRSNAGIGVNEEAGRFYLRSDELNNYDEPGTVLESARQMVDILNGIAELQIQNWEYVTVAGVAREEAASPPTQFLFPEAIRSRSRLSGNVTIKRADGTIDSSETDVLVTVADLAQTDANVRRAMRLFGSEPHDWVNLYRILEIIENDVGNISEIVKRGWATKSEISNFKHTANSVAASGDDARHGKERTIPPTSPMPLPEAHRLIAHLLNNWLKSKE